MKHEHTPGPLVITEDIESMEVQILTPDGYIIATCWDGVNGEHNARENAELYVAAPDMLEALIEECLTCGGNHENVCEQCRRKILIESATGKTIEEVLG